MDGLSWRHVDYLLKQWGRWVWLYGASIGCYPEHSAIVGIWDKAPSFSWFRVRQLTAKGRGNRGSGGHKILCEFGRVMPEFMTTVNIAVGALSEDQYLAVIVQYASGLDGDGHEYSDDHKALALGISVDALEERLRRARKKIGNNLAKATGRHVTSSYCHIPISAVTEPAT